MLAQRKANKRYQAAFYLILLCVLSCTNDSTTIVELRNLQAKNTIKLIERYTQDDIQYDIIGNRIIFYTDKESIQPLLLLLEALDKSPNQYVLRFSWGNHKRYSTTTLPSPIPISLNTENEVSLFNERWTFKITNLNQNQFSLSIFSENTKATTNPEISSVKMNDGTKIKFKFRSQNKEETGYTSYKLIINKNEKTEVVIKGWPKGVFLEILDAL